MIYDKNNHIEIDRTFYLFENKKLSPKKDPKQKNLT